MTSRRGFLGESLLLLLALLLVEGAAACGGSGGGSRDEILQAARAGEATRVARLLEGDPGLLEARDGDGMTPLHHAVLGGHTATAELLLDTGADIEAVDAENRTPLHHAAMEGDESSVALLLSRKANVMAREFRGRTPLFLATNWGNDLGTVERLLAAGADVNDRTERGEEVLYSTLFYGRPEIIEALLAAGARLPEDDARLGHATYVAASNGLETVFALASAEAESRGVAWWERVPMHAAARGGSVPIGQEILDRGAAVDQKNIYGITPLHVAAENGRGSFVEFLLRNGASLDEPSVTGMTALHFAREKGHDEVVGLLLESGATDVAPIFPELRGPWMGQPEPANSPERFAPGIVSGHSFDSEHSPAAFSPDGTEVYWTSAFRGPISYSRLEDGRWTAPSTAPFVSKYGEGEPIFSPDGRRLYFLSMRPLEPGVEGGKENIWYVDREGDHWSEAKPLDAVVNDFDHHWLFSVSASGTLYFSSIREDGYGGRDLFRAEMVEGVYQPPENLGSEINSEGTDHTPFIAPDESYLLFSSSGHDDNPGDFRFFISYRTPEGGWSPPWVLDHVTQQVEQPLCPLVTPDGRFLFFIGSGDIWWTRADFIEEMRPR